MDDVDILKLFQKRDETAIEELKLKYENFCCFTARKILSQREDIEECVNSAYYELWDNIPPAEPANLKTYLGSVVRNIAIDRLKYNSAAKRSSDLAVSLDELAECIPDRNADISTDKLSELISRFLRSQDELHRKIFIRRYWYGDSIAAIAGYFSLKEKTTATYLFRTRKKLKAFLQKEGYFHE